MRLYIGFITYNQATAKYLPYFLPSLKAQTSQDFKIVAIDNSEAEVNENSQYIKNNFPEVSLQRAGKNLGFGRAFNRMIKQAIDNGAKYFLALNPDMIYEPDFVEKMMTAMETGGFGSRIGAVAPKILKWDFEHKQKTEQIDSLGLVVTKEHRFFDARQGEIDHCGAEDMREVFGFTGAAVLFDLKALQDAAFTNGVYKEYFDELMFMYKEDCDLSYRLRLAGWKIILAPGAVAYHNRAVAGVGKTSLQIVLNRQHKSRQVKQWSFLNQWVLLLKLKDLPFSWRVKLATAWYQLKSLAFVLLFEPFLLKELVKLWRLKGEVKKRREKMRVVTAMEEIEKFMV